MGDNIAPRSGDGAEGSLMISGGLPVQLLRRWIFLAVGALGIAGSFAFLAVLTRTPAVRILGSAEALHRAIAGHVTFSLLVWLLAFEAVLWIVASGPVAAGSIQLRGFALSAGGSALLIVALLLGRGAVILTDYVPVVVDPMFFAGLALVFCGVACAASGRFGGKAAGHPMAPRGMNHAAAVGALAVAAFLVGLARLGAAGHVQADFAFFQSLFWVPGHLLQFVNVTAMVSAWYLLLESGFGVVVTDSRPVRFAFAAYPILAGLLLAATLPSDPRSLPSNIWLSVIMGTALALPTALHVGIVARALGRGRWSASPEGAALICSLTLFGGGVLLALLRAGTGSSMWIPAHYHAVVVGGVTMAFMGLTYRLLAETGEIAWPRLALLQPWLYGAGMLLVVIGMNWAGSAGAPRKSFDPALGAAAARWVTPMNLMGAGGVVAVLGGAAFVINALRSLLRIQRPVAVGRRAGTFESLSPSGRRS